MRRRSPRARLAALLLAGAAVAASATVAGAGTEPPHPRKPTVRLVVTFDRGTSELAQDRAAEAAGKVVSSLDALDARVVEVDGDRVRPVQRRLLDNAQVAQVEVDPVRVATIIPDDPKLGAGLGQVGLPAAWDYTTGSSSIVIAVIDTGVNALPDLPGTRFVSPRNVITSTTSVGDSNGHGTSAASVAAMTGNNGLRGAGACWSCSIMPVKALESNGAGLASDVAKGIVWAVDHDADIVNLSLGGSSSGVEKRAIEYAEANGVVVVAAAGNESSSQLSYPAAHPTVLGVAASGQNDDLRQSYSNFGSWVKVAAPGTNFAQDRIGNVNPNGFSGTSSAAPLVAGIVGLMLSENPNQTPADIRARLMNSAADVSYVSSSGGRVNAAAALASVPGAAQDPPPDPPNVSDPGPIFLEPNLIDVYGGGYTNSGLVQRTVSNAKAGATRFVGRCAFCGAMTIAIVNGGGGIVAQQSGGQRVVIETNLPSDGTYFFRIQTERWGVVSYIVSYNPS